MKQKIRALIAEGQTKEALDLLLQQITDKKIPPVCEGRVCLILPAQK